MLKNTFCHVPGIRLKTEQRLWSSGFRCWKDVIQSDSFPFSLFKGKPIKGYVEESIAQLERNNPYYFSNLLPSNELWRLFSEFRNSIAYLDIETTGSAGWENHITTIALYDGKRISGYVFGRNLEDFESDIENYKLIITYSGKCFDVPFIESYLKIRMNHVHIDLRYLLRSLGYSGGLKGCEKKLGLDRGDLNGIDGYFAVLLWDDFVRNNNERALETLLAYNILDVVNLETLMVSAYNLKLKDTPFSETHQLPFPEPPEIPFRADRETLEKISHSSLPFRV